MSITSDTSPRIAIHHAPTSHDQPPRVTQGSDWGAPRRRTLSYLPALDGIRAIAVMAVIIYHANPAWMSGGFLGVDIFFVLSGFLITSILLREIETTGRINFGQFYLRRARRLLPALLLVLVACAALVLLFAHDAAQQLRRDIIASLFYVTNWSNIFAGQSYFEAMGRPPLLQHLWSLGVEEQFYFIWPLIMYLAYRWRGRWGVRRCAAIGIGISTLLMATLSIINDMPGAHDPSRLYFGSDTHAMTILMGAALATAWQPRLVKRALPSAARLTVQAAAASSVIVLILIMLTVTDSSAALYRGGFTLFAGLVAFTIVATTHPAGGAGRILGAQPLRWLGERSYGLYLWHWPIMVLLRPGIDIGLTGVAAFTLQFGLTLIAAELSYRYVEMPIRHGALPRLWRDWREQGLLLRRAVPAIGGTLVLISGLWIGLRAIPDVNAATYLGGATEVGAGSLSSEPNADNNQSGGESSAQSSAESSASAVGAPDIPKPAVAGEDFSKRSITMVGDSVLLGARSSVKKVLPKATIDAAVGRQILEVNDRITQRLAADKLGDVVVIHTGTNGPAYTSDLKKILNQLKDRPRVILVTTHVPLKWMQESNNDINSMPAKYPNVRIADWAGASAGHRNYFVTDGVHLTQAGGQAYAQVILNALRMP